MWTRKELKDRAKAVLKTTYWKAFLASLVLTMVGGGGSVFSFEMDGGDLKDSFFLGDKPEALLGIILLVTGIALTAAVAGILIAVFVGGPLEVGVQKFFVGNQQERGSLNDLGGGFAKESYLKVVTAMFLRSLSLPLEPAPGGSGDCHGLCLSDGAIHSGRESRNEQQRSPGPEPGYDQGPQVEHVRSGSFLLGLGLFGAPYLRHRPSFPDALCPLHPGRTLPAPERTKSCHLGPSAGPWQEAG